MNYSGLIFIMNANHCIFARFFQVNDNKLYKSVLIPLLVLAGLIVSYFIPQIALFGYKLKQTDIFADIRKEKKINLAKSPVAMIPADTSYTSDTTDTGLIRIEDYSDDHTALQAILEALANQKSVPGKVRIGLFGDSFIEGDIFCASLRDTLQDLFGGTGVGFVPLTSEVAQFRFTVSHSFSGFKTHTIATKTKENVPYGAGGYCFIPLENNAVTYTAHKSLKHLNVFKDLKLFYLNSTSAEIRISFDKAEAQKIPLSSSAGMQQLILENVDCKSVSFQFPSMENLYLYGVSFEDNTGLYIDNFGLRGNSGLGLSRITAAFNSQFDSLQQYKLIVLQYGLNVVDTNTTDLNWYIHSMSKVVNQIKASYPGASILLMSVSDRSFRFNGEYITMPGVPVMVNAQRLIAQKTKIAFWDMFSAMGGENSMVKYVHTKPSLANLDYTHLNYRGGRKLAHIFTETLLFELDHYEVKQNHSRDTVRTVAVRH